MSLSAAEKIADAVLFEGYMLYPYRPSALKNRQRWNFGTLFPRGFVERQQPRERYALHAEVPIQAARAARIDLCIRFLQLVPQPGGSADSWDVGLVRTRTIEGLTLETLTETLEQEIDFSTLSADELRRAPASCNEQPLISRLELRAVPLGERLFRVAVTFSNETPMVEVESASRKMAQGAAFTSAHLVLHSAEGAFVSLLDPPAEFAEGAAGCHNEGVFPVLAGEEQDRGTMLCSPIILYDHPQIAPESPGDFFDATEMDEMLALRILTMTDDEKREMRKSDAHARAILERVETMAGERLLRMHGAARPANVSRAPAAAPAADTSVLPWNPFEDSPPVESVQLFGVEVRRGGRVRLWPRKKADIMDSALQGRVAVIEAIEQDLEGHVQCAVVLEDDPGKDLGLLRQPGHRFFFSPQELEPLMEEAP